MQILHDSESYIIVNKPPAVPIQPDKTGDFSLLEKAEEQVGYGLYVVHRLDRPVSGTVLFAKTKQAAAYFSKQFASKITKKTYIAAVRNEPKVEAGHLSDFISKNRNGKAQVFDAKQGDAKQAELFYTTLGKSKHYTFLEIDLITGRHHQIRAQLAAIGCTIKGDVRYGDRRANPDRSIHLHAWKLAFQDLDSIGKMEVEAPLPEGDAVWNSLALPRATHEEEE